MHAMDALVGLLVVTILVTAHRARKESAELKAEKAELREKLGTYESWYERDERVLHEDFVPVGVRPDRRLMNITVPHLVRERIWARDDGRTADADRLSRALEAAMSEDDEKEKTPVNVVPMPAARRAAEFKPEPITGMRPKQDTLPTPEDVAAEIRQHVEKAG